MAWKDLLTAEEPQALPSWKTLLEMERAADPIAATTAQAEALQGFGGTQERFLRTVGPVLGTVFDILQRGQYASANIAEAALSGQWGGIPETAWAGLTGERKGSYIDILNERAPGWPQWLRSGVGFALDVGLDPATYVTFGGGALRKAGQEAGERALIRFAGRAVPGTTESAIPKVFEATDAARQALRESPFGRWVRRTFTSRGEIAGEELWRLHEQAQDEARYLVRQAEEQGISLEKAVSDIERNLGVPREVLMDLVERPTDLATGASRLSPYPEEVRRVVDQFAEMQRSRVEREIAAGVNITPLVSDEIEYMAHYLTPEARRALGENPVTGLRRLIGADVQHPSAIQRNLRDMTAQEINRLSKQGGVIPGFKGPLFLEDPVLVNTMRDVLSARSTAAAGFIRSVADNPDMARPLAVAGEGFRELGEGAKRRFGPIVDGMAFRDDVADALDDYVRKAFDSGTPDEFIKLYDRALRFWRRWTLGTSPTWMMNNMIGNLWNGFVLGGANPARLADASRILLRGRGEQLSHTVRRGDTLSEIAQEYGVTVDRLARANKISDPNRIAAGQRLLIPQGTARIAGLSDAEILDLAERHGVLWEGFYGSERVGQTVQAAAPPTNAILRAAQSAGRAAEEIPGMTFKANRILENWSRLGLFVDGLKRGMSPEDAALRVKKYLFDYGDLSEAERNVLKRIVPFYQWTRFNLPLQVEALVTTPGRQAVAPKALAAVSSTLETPEPAILQPEWMQSGLYPQVSEDPQSPYGPTATFASLRGLPPADLLEILADVGRGEMPTQLNPLALNPALQALAVAMGYDPFGERELSTERAARLLPGVVTDERTAALLEALFPPIGQIRRVVAPYTSPTLPETSPLSRASPIRTYTRSILSDLQSTQAQVERRISDLEYRRKQAVLRENEDEAAWYERQKQEATAELMAFVLAMQPYLEQLGAAMQSDRGGERQ